MFIRTTAPDLDLESMLPAIDEVIMGKYKRFPDQFKQVFRVKGSNRSLEQTTELTGFGQMKAVPENKPTSYDTVLPVFPKTYRHAQYSLGFKVSYLAKSYDKHGVVAKMGGELGKSAKETKEVIAASVFNSGFTTAGPDGQPLFSQNHPLVGGGTQSNLLSYATDPDVISIQLALGAMRQTRDHRGKLINIPPKKLIVPSTLEFIAAELLGGDDRSDTANRAINSFKRRSGLPSFDSWMTWDYLSDPHAWFIQADVQDTELRFYNAEEFNTLHDIEFDTRSIKTAGWMQFSVGFNGFYGVYGVPSA